MKKILVADDHEVVCRGVRLILQEAYDGAEVFEALNVKQLLAQILNHDWDLIILDTLMPGGNFLDILRKIRAHNQQVPILMLITSMEIEYVIQAMKVGANGFIHKHQPLDDFLEAVEQLADGGNYLHRSVAFDAAKILSEATLLKHQLLSKRELEIFRLIALGNTIKQIATHLRLSDKTVATYLARIREKTGLVSYVEIARYSLQNGIVE